MEKKLSLEATEWHYPSKGEYPTEGKTIFATFQEGGLGILLMQNITKVAGQVPQI